MNTKELQIFFDLSLKPFGFKRKNSNWIIREPELTLIINLQRSSYSNLYYLDYGYLINQLDLPLTMHVFYQLSSTDKLNAKSVSELFDFEKPMDENLRMQEIIRV
ncbi:MAG: DUF4304 domain-containing protein [Ignavibacteriales bacterium]|nr:DUF4304 domain-containing protein [Ignavibacteriales bacterium]